MDYKDTPVGPAMHESAPKILKNDEPESKENSTGQEQGQQTTRQDYGNSGRRQQQPQYQYSNQYGNYYPVRKGGWKKGLLIFIIVIACIVGFVFLIGNTLGSSNAYVLPDENYIAKVSVVGEISSGTDSSAKSSDEAYFHKWTLDRIDELINDVNNKGIILYVNTPGGGVYESDELYLKLKEYKESTGRPIYTAMGSMAASGGYYISMASDKIYANRNTWTGSIGVTMGTYFDISDFLKKNGVKTTTITSGNNKAMGSYFDPMTKEQKKILQGIVDDSYNQFVSIIVEGRNMNTNLVRKLGDGRIYTAKQAKSYGLVDEIATYEETEKAMKTEKNLGDCPVVDIRYENNSLFSGLIETNVSSLIERLETIGKSDLDTAMELTEENKDLPIKYLYEK